MVTQKRGLGGWERRGKSVDVVVCVFFYLYLSGSVVAHHVFFVMICVILRCGSRFSGSLSGIEPYLWLQSRFPYFFLNPLRGFDNLRSVSACVPEAFLHYQLHF